MERHKVYEKVPDIGQLCVGAQWMITKKEGQDGLKTKVKARLVARVFQEIEKEQSDSPTVQRVSLWLSLSAVSTIKVQSLR